MEQAKKFAITVVAVLVAMYLANKVLKSKDGTKLVG
jgi:hypothetical protein